MHTLLGLNKYDPERFHPPGIDFRGKLIGIEDVPDARGDKMCQVSSVDICTVMIFWRTCFAFSLFSVINDSLRQRAHYYSYHLLRDHCCHLWLQYGLLWAAGLCSVVCQCDQVGLFRCGTVLAHLYANCLAKVIINTSCRALHAGLSGLN